jgi:hypothetical protein
MLCAGAGWSCTEKGTIAPDLGFLHINPRTVEVVIPFEDFVVDVRVDGGYGSPQDLGRGVIAQDFGGLNSRALVHLADFPSLASVPVGGRVLLVFDTLSGTLVTPVRVELFDVKEEWHAPTVNWDVTVDTAGDRRFWTQPGGGPITSLGGATFDPFVAKQENDTLPLVDTVSIAVDSATVAALGDPSSGTVGLLLAAAEPGVLLRLKSMSLFALAVPSSVSDTVLEVDIPSEDMTFMVDPVPTAPTGWLRVGGAPSWRSVIEILLPRTVDGTAEVCGTAGCQVDLTEVEINLAELVLTTRQTESAFVPEDTLRMDVRRVLKPELLPKSPLGEMLVPFVESIPPELFSVQAGTSVSLSVTDLVKAILANTVLTGTVPKTSMALLSAIEPLMLGFASFEGGGGAGAPALRLLYTVANDVGLP